MSFRRLIDVVGEAVRLPAGEREPYLVSACHDDEELLSEARALVNEAEVTGSVTSRLEERLGRAAVGTVEQPDDHPDTIGPYDIVRPLGQGGMGVVYLARQEKPLRREVAIKVIRRGFGGSDAVARFESERQALALMQHPNIARIYDAGATDEGQPYFVMELVEGPPITDYCDEHRLALNERLALFGAVCDAVQHAHQKGIIHRDLKPSNVLIVSADGRPAPKVIDFGIAKATALDLEGDEVHTRAGVLIGSLDYMSPEQARFDATKVDTRADVYSLGVILYELVTGRHPFQDTTLRRAGLVEAQRIVLERDPPRPSASVGSSDRRSARARDRATDERTLRRSMREDLDWIVMKALEKDPERRYQSPLELAKDIERYERNEPVSAGPPSLTYKGRKFVRRHRAGVTASALVALALMSGTVVATAGFLRATAENQRAQATSRFLTDMLASVRPDVSGRDVTVREVLDDARRRLEQGEVTSDAELEATLALVIGHSYESLGEYDAAVPLLQRSVDLRRRAHGEEDRRVYDALYRLGTVYWKQGSLEPALALRLDLVTLTERMFGRIDPEHAEALSNVANTYADMGDFERAETYLREAVAIGGEITGERGELDFARYLNNLGTVLHDQDRFGEAIPMFRESLEIRARLLGETSDVYAITLGNLGDALLRSGDIEGAESALLRATQLAEDIYGPDHPRTANTYSGLASVLTRQGRHAEAEARSRAALAIHLAASGERFWRVGTERRKLAEILIATGRTAEAEELLHAAWDGLANAQGAGSVRAREVARAMSELQAALGRADSAATWATRAAGS